MAQQTEQARPRTYTIDVWHEESIWTWEGTAANDEEAEQDAVDQLNEDWDRDYADMAEMRADVDGVAVIEHPEVMAERQPLRLVEAGRDLREGIGGMLGDGRLAALAPADRAWIEAVLARAA